MLTVTGGRKKLLTPRFSNMELEQGVMCWQSRQYSEQSNPRNDFLTQHGPPCLTTGTRLELQASLAVQPPDSHQSKSEWATWRRVSTSHNTHAYGQ